MWSIHDFPALDCLSGKSQKGPEVVPHVGHMRQRGGPSLWEKMFILVIVVISQYTILIDN